MMTLWWRQIGASVRMLLLATLVLGVLYPAVGLLLAQALPAQSAGSLVRSGGEVVGSSLIGQQADGPGLFLPRPSAGEYDAMASGGSNLGPNNPQLVDEIAQRRAAVAQREQVNPAQVPPDAVTASGSGLDPDISPAYARLQVPRVSGATGISRPALLALIDQHTTAPALGILGAPGVNVLELNLAITRTMHP